MRSASACHAVTDAPSRLPGSGIKAVCIGGGTGAPVSIKTLLSLGVATDAVVAMADDGGSSGMLREHTGRVPPGDVRKCIAAMASDPKTPWAKAFQVRFNYVNNHTLGNLMLTALEETAGSFTEAVRLCEELLGARGHVYPSTLQSVVLTGATRDGRSLTGQSALCSSQAALATVALQPAAPEPNRAALDALCAADMIVLGPGSLFTSVIPNLLVPGILEAVRSSKALVVFVCSLGDMQGETWGLSAAEHVSALLDHGMRGALDVVVAHRDPDDAGVRTGTMTAMFEAICANERVATGAAPAPQPRGSTPTVRLDEEDARHIRHEGLRLIACDLRDVLRPTWHDEAKLAAAFEGVIQLCRSPLR
ncbi:MAG: YvcK family protein [Coriobacteriales bacterium]|jgi:uncharacterized cofD-like protein|nr:YvcK family protein [Coriobacteriales bacterium]